VRTLLPLLLVNLSACPPTGEVPDTGHPMDWDVDGFFGRDDCDDDDPDVHPGAEEACDGVDNDCDGDIDEGFEDSHTWYADSDGDGYGDPQARAQHCEQPEGWVADNTDCDDTDPAVYPGAEDTWYDGVDSDCDRADDHDADADGWPWEGSGGEDCDDADPTAHPGVLDWVDETDRDCDGVQDATRLAALPGVALGGFDDGLLGAALATVPDQDGDGVEDLLVGSPGIGAAWLLAGPLTGSVQLPGQALARLWGEAIDSQAGGAVAVAGDTDGDGTEELLVGSWLAGEGRGALSLVRGPVGGDVALVDAAWRIEGAQVGDWLGYAAAGVGDPDGDGYDDLLVGARGWSDVADNAGAAWLLRGGPEGPQPLAEGVMIFGVHERDFAGCAVDGPGDLDGDGLDDLLVGARGEDSGGGAFVFLDAITGPRGLDSADGMLLGEEPYDYAGWSLAGPGDVDADGYDDLLVGAYGRDGWMSATGAAYLVYGRGREAWVGLEGLVQADASYDGERSQDHAGWAVAGPGDVDGDDRPDLLIGAPGADLGEDNSGTVYLLLDPGEGSQDLEDAALRLRGESGETAGTALAPTVDHDGDGLPDLLLGLPGQGGDGAGAIRVVGLAR
jgi:hypothetical protein